MTEIVFTHTQFKSDVVIYADLIFGAMVAPAMKSVVVLGPGGVSVPVEGTLPEVLEKIRAAKSASKPLNTTQEVESGISVSEPK